MIGALDEIVWWNEWNAENEAELKRHVAVLGDGCKGKARMVLEEWRPNLFRGIPVFIGFRDGLPVTLNITHIGKRKTGVWEPYANCYTLWTRKDVRRQGFCHALFNHVKAQAIAAGCVRHRSLAGTYDGYAVHRAVGDEFWALTPKNELMIDSGWVTPDGGWPTDKPPKNARLYTDRLTPLSGEELDEIVRTTKLRYEP
jgi:hypothetical protein